MRNIRGACHLNSHVRKLVLVRGIIIHSYSTRDTDVNKHMHGFLLDNA